MSLLNESTAQDFIHRLESLKSDTTPQWGKMNASEMIKHCKLALDIPLEKISMKPNWFFKFLFGKWIKSKMTNDEIYSQGSPTAKEFVVHDKNLSIDNEKTLLIQNIRNFVALSDEKLGAFVHPLVGKMTANEWRKSQWKHLDHHWRQFGI